METVLRVVGMYVLVWLGIRVIGKREFSQLSPFELVTLLLIPELVQQAIVREDFSFTNAMIALSTLFLLVFLISVVVQWSPKVEAALEGQPAVLAYNGCFVEGALQRERITPDEFYEQIRKAGLERLEQVKWGLLESDGRISIVPRSGEGRTIVPEPEPIA